MDYENWYQEYEETVNKINIILKDLAKQRKEHPRDETFKRKQSYWYGIRRELVQTAALLKKRYGSGVHSNV